MVARSAAEACATTVIGMIVEVGPTLPARSVARAVMSCEPTLSAMSAVNRPLEPVSYTHLTLPTSDLV